MGYGKTHLTDILASSGENEAARSVALLDNSGCDAGNFLDGMMHGPCDLG